MTVPQRLLRALSVLFALLLGAGLGIVPSADGDTSGTVFLNTVPSMANVHLTVAGVPVTTRNDGTASVPVANLNGIAGQVGLGSHWAGHGVRVSISKVAPGAHVSHQSHLSVGLDVSSLVQLVIDSGRTGVAVTSVGQVDLHSSAGQKVKIHPNTTASVRLLSRRTELVHGTLRALPVTWLPGLVSVAPGVALTTDSAHFDPFGHSTWKLHLATIHGQVIINTVPRTPDVSFELEGATVTTGANGTAIAPVADQNGLGDRLRLASPDAGPVQVSGLRVTKLPPRRLHERRLVAAIDVRRPVALKFIDMNGVPVQPRNITAMRMTVGGSSVRLTGQEIGAPALLLDSVATKIGANWQTRPISYVLRSVSVDGSEAVFDGRQHFSPHDSATWTVQLAVFTVTVTAHDAIFGTQIKSHAVITKPDGSRYQFDLRGSKPSVVRSVVRGMYGLKIDSAVIGGQTSMLVSRDDQVDLRVITLLDAVLVAGIALFLLIAALAGGRLMARRRRPTRQGT